MKPFTGLASRTARPEVGLMLQNWVLVDLVGWQAAYRWPGVKLSCVHPSARRCRVWTTRPVAGSSRTICPPARAKGVVSHTRPSPAAIARGLPPSQIRYSTELVRRSSPTSWYEVASAGCSTVPGSKTCLIAHARDEPPATAITPLSEYLAATAFGYVATRTGPGCG